MRLTVGERAVVAILFFANADLCGHHVWFAQPLKVRLIGHLDKAEAGGNVGNALVFRQRKRAGALQNLVRDEIAK